MPAPRRRAAAAPPPRESAFAHRNLPLLLLQARERVLARFRPILNAHGVTEQQWRIVRALFDTGPLEPRQIGALVGISSPSLAGVLARMEELGLVQRERLDEDQRRVRVSPTAAARALARRMAPRIDDAYEQIAAEIDPARMAALYAALDEIIALLGPPEPGAEE